MWYKHSFGSYELFWLSKKWIALSQVVRGKGNQKEIKEHGVCVQYLQSNLLYLQIFKFHVYPGISLVEIDTVTSRMDIKWSWNVPLTIWCDSGSSGNLKIIPISAGLMIALTSLFQANSNKTNNIQSDHQHLFHANSNKTSNNQSDLQHVENLTQSYNTIYKIMKQ